MESDLKFLFHNYLHLYFGLGHAMTQKSLKIKGSIYRLQKLYLTLSKFTGGNNLNNVPDLKQHLNVFLTVNITVRKEIIFLPFLSQRNLS